MPHLKGLSKLSFIDIYRGTRNFQKCKCSHMKTDVAKNEKQFDQNKIQLCR